MLETETSGPYLVRKLKWGSHAPPEPPVATPLQINSKEGSLRQIVNLLHHQT